MSPNRKPSPNRTVMPADPTEAIKWLEEMGVKYAWGWVEEAVVIKYGRVVEYPEHVGDLDPGTRDDILKDMRETGWYVQAESLAFPLSVQGPTIHEIAAAFHHGFGVDVQSPEARWEADRKEETAALEMMREQEKRRDRERAERVASETGFSRDVVDSVLNAYLRDIRDIEEIEIP